jgi:uncharacterized protein (DUF1697 family)
MTTYVALLRAVNVGGTGKLPMSELVAIAKASGFTQVRTYIASGNVVFNSRLAEHAVKAALEKRLAAYAGKPLAVMVRTAEELAAVLRANPFPDAAPNRTMTLFLDQAPPANSLAAMTGLGDEQVRLGKREIYVLYGADMAKSKLRIPAAKTGTARNMNTVARLVTMSVDEKAANRRLAPPASTTEWS